MRFRTFAAISILAMVGGLFGVGARRPYEVMALPATPGNPCQDLRTHVPTGAAIAVLACDTIGFDRFTRYEREERGYAMHLVLVRPILDESARPVIGALQSTETALLKLVYVSPGAVLLDASGRPIDEPQALFYPYMDGDSLKYGIRFDSPNAFAYELVGVVTASRPEDARGNVPPSPPPRHQRRHLRDP